MHISPDLRCCKKCTNKGQPKATIESQGGRRWREGREVGNDVIIFQFVKVNFKVERIW